MDENLESHAKKRKAELQKKKEWEKAGLDHTGKPRLPVMSKTEQTKRLHELKAELLTNKKLTGFVEKMFSIAMDDDHPGQMASIKIIADRILPAQGFTMDSKKSTGVTINITGLQVEKTEEKDVSEPVSIQ